MWFFNMQYFKLGRRQPKHYRNNNISQTKDQLSVLICDTIVSFNMRLRIASTCFVGEPTLHRHGSCFSQREHRPGEENSYERQIRRHF